MRTIDHTWIPLSNGTRLAARLWLPEDAERRPVPAILEYLPYRKGDAFAVRDSRHHPWFAAHGYAGVRVDIRGSGDSDGLLLDEYLPSEQADAVEVIAWLAEQPWCSGEVAMLGISWGGFNGLQVAALRPPQLRAVVSMCASDDRYADDVHYKGGCVLAVDMLQWAATMLTLCVMPPDPAAVGDGWRATWMERLEGAVPMVEPWLAHQRRDAYWRQGSVCEDPAAIAAPVYAVGGWADGYTNAIPRLAEALGDRCRALIGPWSHAFPQDSVPGPSIGFLQECVRFFDRHLKGAENGIDAGVRVWMQEPVAPATHHDERPGRWIAEPAWPPPSVEPLVLELPQLPARHRSAESVGSAAGAWCPDGGEGDWPGDQREEDEGSLALTFAPLPERIELLGFPEVELRLEADRPRALIAVRLCDVAPDGSSLLVSRGLLNLTHRDGHEHPEPLEPGRAYDVRVRLDAIAQAIPAGHRLRVAISTAYWPWAWPSPEPATITVHEGRLIAPARRAPAGEQQPPSFGPPEQADPIGVDVLEPGHTTRTHSHDPATGVHEVHFDWDVGGRRRLRDAGTEMADVNRTTYRIADGNPLSAEVEVFCRSDLGRGEWQTRVETRSRMRATATEFLVTQRLDAYEGDEPVCSRTWDLSFPRDNV